MVALRRAAAAGLIAALAISPSVAADVVQVIDNGTPPPSGSPLARSTVGLLTGSSGFEVCSATLIAPHWAATAAHCVTADPKEMTGVADPDDVRVVFGNARINASRYAQSPVSGPFVTLDRKPFIHPEFGGLKEIYGPDAHDVALLHFPDDIPEGFGPARFLQEPDAPLVVGSPVTIAGYGIDRPGKLQSEFKLKLFDTLVHEFTPNSSIVVLRPAKDHPGGSCQGDSGGPAYVKVGNDYVLWGVSSAAYASCTSSARYEDLRKYRDWIREVLGRDAGPLVLKAAPPTSSILGVRGAVQSDLTALQAAPFLKP